METESAASLASVLPFSREPRTLAPRRGRRPPRLVGCQGRLQDSYNARPAAPDPAGLAER